MKTSINKGSIKIVEMKSEKIKNIKLTMMNNERINEKDEHEKGENHEEKGEIKEDDTKVKSKRNRKKKIYTGFLLQNENKVKKLKKSINPVDNKKPIDIKYCLCKTKYDINHRM